MAFTEKQYSRAVKWSNRSKRTVQRWSASGLDITDKGAVERHAKSQVDNRRAAAVKGGESRSTEKRAASIANGVKGGRPMDYRKRLSRQVRLAQNHWFEVGETLMEIYKERGLKASRAAIANFPEPWRAEEAMNVCRLLEGHRTPAAPYHVHLEALKEMRGDVPKALRWIDRAAKNGWNYLQLRVAIRHRARQERSTTPLSQPGIR